MECFVIQPFDSGKFDRRYSETFEPAISKAGFAAYRVDKDPAVTDLVEGIKTGIERASVVLVDISLDHPNVWYELGYALANHKPFCIVCSDEREGSFPFDISKLKIIRYKTESGGDFMALEEKITERLKAVATQARQLETLSVSIASTSPRTGTELDGFEVAALVIIFESHLERSVSSWSLVQAMQNVGFTKSATTLAVINLVDREFIHGTSEADESGNSYMTYLVTKDGLNWVKQNVSQLQLVNQRQSPVAIREEDIPF